MASVASCASCNDPLVLEVHESDDDEDTSMEASSSDAATAPKTVPDDVLLGCGCHYHWACLLESITSTDCPNCSKLLTTQAEHGPQILCRLHNEGGVQDALDLMPTLTEEAYCNAHPEERKPRAFLEFCRNGDLPAIVEMLQDDDVDGGEGDGAQHPMSMADILRYQDPIGKQYTGLHAAIEAKSREVVFLLLLLASKLDLQQFPAAVFQEAAALGVMRNDAEVESKPDIRGAQDAQGRTAEQLAAQVGPPFHDWIGKGILSLT